jgi:hypothetical protein
MTKTTPAPTPDRVSSAGVDLPFGWTGLLLQAQRDQCGVLDAWQQACAALSREWWDEWACRWAGGVPIDA